MRSLVIGALISAGPAAADVTTSAQGFVAANTVTIAAPPAAVWAALVEPSRYWNPAHSYSGDAANFSLDPKAGGCFCERWDGGAGAEHMRVVLVWPEKMLRLSGGLGPLQSEGLAGTLTWGLKPAGAGTEVTQTYVVGGNMRMDSAKIAPLVAAVIGEQLTRLAALFSRPPASR